MIHAGFGLLAAGLLVLAAVSGPAMGMNGRCSIAPFPSARDPEVTYLLGSATPDTLLAGAGRIEASAGPGHWGRGEERPIYGQVIEVERFGGADSASVARAFARQGARRVVIVPWDYDPSCRTAIWSRSAQWVALGRLGAFTVRLRPESEWAEALPTFDAFLADIQPYPLGVFFQRGYRGTEALRTQPSLTASEFLDLYRDLPAWDAIRQDPEAAWAALARWERENPDLARTYPAPDILESVRWSIRHAVRLRVLHRIVPRVAGTYRFTFSVAGTEEERTFYARTGSVPVAAWPEPPGGLMVDDPGDAPPRPDGYRLLATGALSLDALPSECPDWTGRAAIAVLDPPEAPGENRQEWTGKIELRLLTGAFPADSALARFARGEWEQIRRRASGLPPETPARFAQRPDGLLQVDQRIVLEDGNALVLRGERISRETFPCPL